MVLRVLAIIVAMLAATSVAAQTDYRLRPGDRLQVEVLEDSTLNRTVLVLPDGSISLPLAGAVGAGGRTTTQVANALAQALAPNFATVPTVSVSVASLAEGAAGGTVARAATIDVYFLGEVSKPGQVSLERGTTVLQALSLTGGFTRFAATKRIQLRRTDPRSGQQTTYTINFRAIEKGASDLGGTVLADGDVIIVPERRLFE